MSNFNYQYGCNNWGGFGGCGVPDISNCDISKLFSNKSITDGDLAHMYIGAFNCQRPVKSRLRFKPASTIVKENYYSSLQQYRENRCQTYKQKVFDFIEPATLNKTDNSYIVNCQPNALNTENLENPENNTNLSFCKLAIYKPSNVQFAKEGAVTSGTRLFRLKVNTIKNELATSNKNIIGLPLKSRDIVTGTDTTVPFVFNNKAQQTCVNDNRHKYKNKKICNLL